MEEEEEDARELCRNIQRIIRCGGQMQDVIDYLQREIVIMDGEDILSVCRDFYEALESYTYAYKSWIYAGGNGFAH